VFGNFLITDSRCRNSKTSLNIRKVDAECEKYKEKTKDELPKRERYFVGQIENYTKKLKRQ